MSSAPDSLPDDVESLKALVRTQAQQLQQATARIITLQEQLNLALARRYAASSEKVSVDQIKLFDEAETDAALVEISDAELDTVEVAGHTRKKRGRKPLPDSLPRIDVVHELPESERVCPHDGSRKAMSIVFVDIFSEVGHPPGHASTGPICDLVVRFQRADSAVAAAGDCSAAASAVCVPA